MTSVITYPGEAGEAEEYDPTTSGSHSDKTGLDRKSIHKKHTQAKQTLGTALATAHHEARLIKEIKSGLSHKYNMFGRGAAKWEMLSQRHKLKYSIISEAQYSYLSVIYRVLRGNQAWWDYQALMALL